MKTQWAAPAAITILLAILGGALVANEPSSPVPDEVVEAPAAVSERADGVGKDIQDAAVAEPAASELKPPSDFSADELDSGFIPSARPSSSSRGRPGVDSDRAEMLLRLSASDRVSGIRMSVGEEAVKKIAETMRKSNPDVNLEIDRNTIIARGSVADLRTLRSSLLALGQTEDTKDWPPGLQVDVHGWQGPAGVSPESAIPEKTTIIPLEHLPASSAADVLRNLFPSPPNKMRIGTEHSTNTLILRGPSDQLEEFQAILLKLDQPSREPPQPMGSPFDRAGTMQPDSHIQAFPLRHVLAQELAPTLRELYAENIKVTVNDRTNSLLVIASRETLGRIEDLVRQLDQPADTTAATRRNDAAKPRAAAEAEAEYAAAERRAAALAAQTDKTVRDIRDIARLRAAVGQAFEWRQRRQRAELELLRARLKTIERDIDRRDRIRKAIIDHRVEELLKPELRWEPDEPQAAPDDGGIGATRVAPPLDDPDRSNKGQLGGGLASSGDVAVAETELAIAERNFHQMEPRVIGGPAAKAGLQQGDIIIGVRSWETVSRSNLLFALASAETPGDSESELGAVKVLFLRKAEPRSTMVVIGSRGHLRPHDDEDGTPTGDDTPKVDVSSGRPATPLGADHVRE